MSKLLSIITIGLILNTYPAYEVQSQTPTQETQKQTRAMEREQKRKTREVVEEYAFEEAVQAIRDNNWVLKADMAYTRRGKAIQVTDNTNFIQVEDSTVYVQLAFEGYSRQNGLGGVTLEGRLSNMTSKTDPKGNITYILRVSGLSLSAEITLILSKGNNFAQATVMPTMSGNNIRFSGTLLPGEKANIYRSGFIRY